MKSEKIKLKAKWNNTLPIYKKSKQLFTQHLSSLGFIDHNSVEKALSTGMEEMNYDIAADRWTSLPAWFSQPREGAILSSSQE